MTLNGTSEQMEYLFNPKLLEQIDFENECKGTYNPPITIANPGKSLVMRPLSLSDYDKGFIKLLGYLTDCGDVSIEQYMRRFYAMKKCLNTYFITVIEDTESQTLVGSATLVIEQKFIHSIAVRGRIEDVVTLESHRGLQLGKLLVDGLTQLSKHLGCYKSTLECRDNKISFYNKFGFEKSEGNNYMVCRF